MAASKARWGLALAAALFVPVVSSTSTGAAAEVVDDIGAGAATPIGTFGGIDYVQYDGVFEGETSTGAFRVPYQITAPADPSEGNATVVVEPSHFAIKLGTLDVYLGRDLLLSRGFVHAGIGWSDVDNRILDPTVPGVFVSGGTRQYGGHTDDEIIVDFARALTADIDAVEMAGTAARRYLVGFSDSTNPILRLVTSGRAAGVFDLALPFTAEKHDPQPALAAGRYDGKLVVVNSELERPKGFLDTGIAADQYRFHAVAGAPHIPDHLVSPAGPPSSPASFSPELRARFVQGHDWVVHGTSPPASTQLRTSRGSTIDRDARGNAIVEYADGRLAPRLPFVELGEATYIAGFRGSLDAVQSVTSLGFASHAAYFAAFDAALADQLAGGFILPAEADAMRARAALCAPLTFTESYRAHYERFVTIEPCP